MKKEDKIYLINLIEKLKRTDDMLRLHRTNDSEVMLKQYEAISTDTIFEILKILYTNNVNHELANKISFSLFLKYPSHSTDLILREDEIIPNIELMLD